MLVIDYIIIKMNIKKNYSFKPKISKNTNLILQRKQRIKDLMREKQLFEDYYKQFNITEKNKENKDKKEEENKKINELIDENINSDILKKKKDEKKIINNYSMKEDEQYKKYFIINSKFLPLNKRPIAVNIYNNNNFKLFCSKNKTGRNFINTNQPIKHISNEEKERPTTNCSTTNSKSKSIVNLIYYDNLI